MDRDLLKRIVIEQLQEFQTLPPLIQRTLPKDFNVHLREPEISVITGVRRCGKSTLFKQIRSLLPSGSGAYFFDLEHPLLEDFGVQDFQTVYELWLELYPAKEGERLFIFYDEIQNIKNWERWVRNLAKSRNHKVFVTGSNSEMLSGELATTLTGRHRPIHMMPLSFLELSDHALNFSQLDPASRESTETIAKKNQIIESLLKVGGFPRPALQKDTTLLPLYFNDIITKDIIKRHKIRNSQALVRLGEILCRENTRLFNKNKTARLLDVKDNSTFSKYCSYFQETFLFHEIRQHSMSLRKQMRSLSKFYCVDPALPRTVAGSGSTGYSAEFENLVFLELKRKFPELSYWRSKQGLEVDFIAKSPHRALAFQAAYSVASADTLEREAASLRAIHEELGLTDLCIVTTAENRTLSIDSLDIRVISLDHLALELS